MHSAEISRRWLRYYEDNGHLVVPSASLIANDPTLLLVNAGMVPFKPYFLGERTPPSPRMTSVQKCVRTLDIDEVGKTTRHASFFQMCGNFSVGDYFKEGAITYAWDLLTKPVIDGGFGLPESKLWVTVYVDDDEAEDIWRRKIGVPAERIQRLGMEDNFWSMGVPGPCGPCSEINFDRGPAYGQEGGPAVNSERYIEFWNLVFMQNIRGEGGEKTGYPILGELPSKNIDTGLGLERLAILLQDVNNLFEIDITRPVMDRAADLVGVPYGTDHKSDVALRVVADHIKSATMLIADGVTPGNEGRGYVLRRMMRRAIRSMRLLGAHDPVIHELTAASINVMAPSYPELNADSKRIDAIAVAEEAAFLQTLKSGTTLFDLAVKKTKKAGQTELAGDQAFQLHDTYGFPIDLTLEMASEAGLTVDEEGFRSLMAEQRKRAKDDAQARKHGHADLTMYKELVDRGPTEFTGFDELTTEATVLALIADGVRVPTAIAGQEVEVILDRSPLYAESGGQIADRGTIVGSGLKLRVDDVQKIAKKLWVHKTTIEKGQITDGDAVLAQVDPAWRRGATQGHSGTHMVHAALRQILGPNAVQAGSMNKPGYLRFDFNWSGQLSDQQKADIEAVTNDAVGANYPVNTFVTDLPNAKKMGAMALFGENYGDEVRVVEIGGPFSMELCGGTHVESSADIGPVTILGESSIGSGVRRVEAFVGLDSYRYLAKERALLASVASTLKVPSEEVPGRIEQIVERLRDTEKEIAVLRTGILRDLARQLTGKARDVRGVSLVAEHVSEPVNTDELRKLTLDVREQLDGRPAVIVLTGLNDDRPIVVAATNAQAREHGLKAGQLVRAASKVLKGGGGGKDDIAQGGGSDAAYIQDALQAVGAEVANVA